MPNLLELRERRVNLAVEMQSIVEADWDKATENRFDAMHEELVTLDKRIDAADKLQRSKAQVAARTGEIVSAPTAVEDRKFVIDDVQERSALSHYLRGTLQSAPAETREYAITRMSEARAQSVGTSSAGGYLVRGEFATQLEVARALYGAMLGVSTIYTTQTGAALLLPTVNDTTVSGSILAENAAISESAMTFGQTSITSYMYTSGLVLVSYQLLEDSEFPLEAFIAEALGRRLGAAQNAHWTTGTGSSQPSGVVTGATVGVTASTGSTTTTTYANLVDMSYSVNPVYRTNARWMFRDATGGIIRKLVDGQSRPIWEPSLVPGTPDSLLGYPITINPDVAAMAASAKSVLFGDFSKYIIRDVSGIQIKRLDERYADNLQVGFYAFQRTGGAVLDAGGVPIRFLTQAAT